MAKKRKVKGKATGANRSRADLAEQVEILQKELADFRSTFLKQEDVLRDQRISNRKLTQRNEEMLHELGKMNDQIEEMYRESYALVKCLNATRESWMKAEDKVQKLERGQQMQAFTMKVEMADGSDDPDCTFVGLVGANAD